jgi:hypothetical protein
MKVFLRSVVAAAVVTTALHAADPPTIGILPFDVSAAEGSGSGDAGRSLATLIRIEMLPNKEVRPQLLDPPAGARRPLLPKAAAAAGQAAGVDYVISGTVLEASVKSANNSAASRLLGNVAGSVSRTSAKIRLHIEIVRSGTSELQLFEVEADNTDVGLGGTVHTTLGSFGAGDPGWQKTPMGKALREAAQKITKEVAKRTKP